MSSSLLCGFELESLFNGIRAVWFTMHTIPTEISALCAYCKATPRKKTTESKNLVEKKKDGVGSIIKRF